MTTNSHFRLTKLSRMILCCLVSSVVFSLVFAKSVLAYNDCLIHRFWVNDSNRDSQDFQLVILPGNASNGSPFINYVSGWAAVDTANTGPNFVQVGILADGTGVRWFAYTTATATCFSNGLSAWNGLGCVGGYNDHVAVGMWTRVELVNYGQGFWIARVWDQGNHPVDVAKLNIAITRANSVYASSEQSYTLPVGLQLTMDFNYYNPQYMLWGTGFQHWPTATANYQNWFYTQTNAAGKTICPPYGYKLNGSSPPFWFMGKTTSTVTCSSPLTF